MEENKLTRTEPEKTDSNKADQMPTAGKQGNLRPLHEVDQQEGNMDNGTLGGNLEDSPEVKGDQRDR